MEQNGSPALTRVVRVECHAGYRGDEEPRALWLDGRRLEVTELLVAWVEPGRRCFRVRTDGGHRWLLVHSAGDDLWRAERQRIGGG